MGFSDTDFRFFFGFPTFFQALFGSPFNILIFYSILSLQYL